ncbi:hypothetical protein CONCODRAFT_34976 [Conidiobolus coronatus NRRL 28638]|uniref:Ubiquitin-like domain-containing protein n=1 Tax=Conidiobolus coronatus (strain ATCC 28846 / CBS 209.66 / NRRL 28638) TaxID=796925 RepID=A0A137PGJ5_CONC2|nr:hypothetical protein CONCODRAFT_34976 [Conidiobolus coronatus NRRL 28638]|eukprot:KXN74129.1 hypothetical protein CONCODRAFT_34976 [Conidiobolus coronatus NRRL 28638]
MKIIIKIFDQKEVPIISTGDLKIKVLKTALDEIIGYSLKDRYLVFEDKVLREDETLEQLGIQDSSIIHLCKNLIPFNLRKPEKILVFVKTVDGKRIPAVVDSNIKAEDLSKIIQPALGYLENEQSLHFESKLLEKGKSLDEFGVQNSSTIHLRNNLLLPSSQTKPLGITVYIKTLDGKQAPLWVSGDIQIKQLLERIKNNYEYDISEYSLVFGGKLLKMEKSLVELGICNYSVIHLIHLSTYHNKQY